MIIKGIHERELTLHNHRETTMEKKMEAINEKPKKSKIKEIILENLLIILMIISVIIGVCLGVGLRGIWSPDEKKETSLFKVPRRSSDEYVENDDNTIDRIQSYIFAGIP